MPAMRPEASHRADFDITEEILEIEGDADQHQDTDGGPGDLPTCARRFSVHRVYPSDYNEIAFSRTSTGAAGSATSAPIRSSIAATAGPSAALTGALKPMTPSMSSPKVKGSQATSRIRRQV